VWGLKHEKGSVQAKALQRAHEKGGVVAKGATSMQCVAMLSSALLAPKLAHLCARKSSQTFMRSHGRGRHTTCVRHAVCTPTLHGPCHVQQGARAAGRVCSRARVQQGA